VRIFGIRAERRQLLYLVGDVLFALLAIALGHLLRFGPSGPHLLEILRGSTGATAVFISTNLLTIYVAGGYDPRADFRQPRHMLRVWGAVVAALLLQMVVFYSLPLWLWGRGIAGLTSLGFLFLVSLWRAGICQLRPRLAVRTPTLILGADEAGHVIAELIQTHTDEGRMYELLGFVDDRIETTAFPLPIVGGTRDLQQTVNEHGVTCLIVALRGGMSPELTKQLLDLKAHGTRIEDMRWVYKRLTGKVPIHYLSDTSLIFGPMFLGSQGVGAAAQRVADVLIASVGLVLSVPIIAVASIAISLESKGGVFFTQERVGLDEQPFTMIKLRTMAFNAEADTGPVWSTGAFDHRVTRVGRFLRRSRIDELPQFWNILRGDMSLVGPRPERAHFVKELKTRIPFYSLRFAVKPGVTGWAQVNYRYGASEEDAAEKLCYDLYAIQELNPILYLIIMLKTVQTVLLRPGS